MPRFEYYHYDRLKGNGQSRLLQAIKNCILIPYPRSSIHGDGQVVVIQFSDGMKFEILPAFKETDYYGYVSYVYPDSNMGGNWRSTNPKKEQEAMRAKNCINQSNGLLFDTCKYLNGVYAPTLYAPGSNIAIDSSNSYICLGKVLNKIMRG